MGTISTVIGRELTTIPLIKANVLNKSMNFLTKQAFLSRIICQNTAVYNCFAQMHKNSVRKLRNVIREFELNVFKNKLVFRKILFDIWFS